MKSILIGLTLTFWIASYSAYTQTVDNTDTVYCLPMVKARLLVADALRLRVLDSLHNLQTSRIALLDSEIQSVRSSYTKLLKIEQEKQQRQSEITSHMEGLAGSYRDQMNFYQKQDRKHRRQNKLLAGLVILIGGLAITK